MSSFLHRHKFALPLAVIFVAIMPFVTWAANTGGLTPIVPQGGEGCPLGYTAFFKVIQNVLTDAVILAVIFSVLLIAYAGFLFVTNTASPEGVSKGRAVLTSTIIGFVIVLTAWLIVNEFISVFTNGSIASFTSLLQPTSKNLCLTAPPAVSSPVTSTSTSSSKESSVRAIFKKNGIAINKKACPSGIPYTQVSGGCTDVGGMRQATIQQVINIKQACSSNGNQCSVTVTGGSELGHAKGTYSHGNGYKVDLRSVGSGAAMSYWIENGGNGYITKSTSRSGDCAGTSPTWNDSYGNQYVIESGNGSTCWSHWDITVRKAGKL